MAEPYIVTRGVVLRETVTSDTDKILTLLTEDRGKTPVLAKGARKKNCKFAAAAQPLTLSEWTLYRRGDWYHANEAATLEEFRGLRENLEALSLACYMAELTEAAVPEELPSIPLLRHLLNGLYALSVLRKPPELVKPVFEMKLLSLSGYEPLIDKCAYCGNPDPAEPLLDIRQGVLHCRTCGREPASASRALCRESLAAVRRTLYGDERKLYSFRLNPGALRRLNDVTEAFLLTQMDRRFQTLDFYKSMKPAANADSRNS